jgi:hypothetical protein
MLAWAESKGSASYRNRRVHACCRTHNPKVRGVVLAGMGACDFAFGRWELPPGYYRSHEIIRYLNPENQGRRRPGAAISLNHGWRGKGALLGRCGLPGHRGALSYPAAPQSVQGPWRRRLDGYRHRHWRAGPSFDVYRDGNKARPDLTAARRRSTFAEGATWEEARHLMLGRTWLTVLKSPSDMVHGPGACLRPQVTRSSRAFPSELAPRLQIAAGLGCAGGRRRVT